MIFHIFGAVAQFERELLVERTNIGLAAARARGHVGGRRRCLSEKQADVVRRMYDSRQYRIKEIARSVHVSNATVYRYLDQDYLAKKNGAAFKETTAP